MSEKSNKPHVAEVFAWWVTSIGIICAGIWTVFLFFYESRSVISDSDLKRQIIEIPVGGSFSTEHGLCLVKANKIISEGVASVTILVDGKGAQTWDSVRPQNRLSWYFCDINLIFVKANAVGFSIDKSR